MPGSVKWIHVNQWVGVCRIWLAPALVLGWRQTRRTDVQETEPSSIRENIISFVNKVQTQIDLSIFMYVCKYVCTSIVQLQLGKLVIDIRSSVTIALFHLGCTHKKIHGAYSNKNQFFYPIKCDFRFQFSIFFISYKSIQFRMKLWCRKFSKKNNEKKLSNWKKALYNFYLK